MMRLLALSTLIAAAAWAQGSNLPPDYASRMAEIENLRRQSPGDLRVLEALAGSYSMAGRYDKAIELLREMLERTASDPTRQDKLRLRLAQNLAWSGDTARAIGAYKEYLQGQRGDRQATMELIRLLRYRGDYTQAEEFCDRLLASNVNDAEAFALKAEVLHWAGNRHATARAAADRAATLDPDSPDAKVAQIYAMRDRGENRAALREFGVLADQVARRGGVSPESTFGDAYRLLERDLAQPHLLNNPAFAEYDDSDGIRNIYSGFEVGIPFFDDHRLRLQIAHHRSSAPLTSLFTAGREASQVSEFAAGGNFRLAPAVHLNVLGGGSRRSTGSGLRPVFDLQITASPFDRWTFDFESGREFLKLTPRAIDRDISSYKVAAGVQYAFDARTALSARLDRRVWSDDNSSLTGSTTLRRILHYYRPFMVDAGLLSRWELFDRDTRFAAGFFTPERYLRHDAFLGLHGELGHRVSYELRGAGGAQQIARGADYRSSWELASSMSIRLARSLELYANYQRRNYSMLSRNGWYHGFYITLGFRP